MKIWEWKRIEKSLNKKNVENDVRNGKIKAEMRQKDEDKNG